MGGEEGEKTRRKDKYQKMLSYGSAQETWLLSSKAGLHLVWGRDTPEGDITWFGNQDVFHSWEWRAYTESSKELASEN